MTEAEFDAKLSEIITKESAAATKVQEIRFLIASTHAEKKSEDEAKAQPADEDDVAKAVAGAKSRGNEHRNPNHKRHVSR